MDAAVAHFGRIDVLVNCAGIIKHTPIEEMSVELFEQRDAVNLTGTFICCQAVVAGDEEADGREDRQHRVPRRAHRAARAWA